MQAARHVAPIAVSLCIAVAAATAGAENSGGYPGPHRNGLYPAEGLLRRWPEGGPKRLWKTDGIGRGCGAPCRVEGTVYVTGVAFRKAAHGKREGAGTVYAFGPDGRLYLRQGPRLAVYDIRADVLPHRRQDLPAEARRGR